MFFKHTAMLWRIRERQASWHGAILRTADSKIVILINKQRHFISLILAVCFKCHSQTHYPKVHWNTNGSRESSLNNPTFFLIHQSQSLHVIEPLELSTLDSTTRQPNK
jgi:hypothetical protein